MVVVLGGRGINYGWMVKRLLVVVEVGKRTCLGDRQSSVEFFGFFSLPVGGKSVSISVDGHYRRYVARKLRSDGTKTSLYGK